MENLKGGAFAIGQKVDGGIVFYVDKSGQHGLIAAPVDQGGQISWNDGPAMKTLAVRNGIGQGNYNTEKIMTAHKEHSSAALQCAKYLLEGHGDWYLPSIYELDLMYRAIGNGGTGPNRNLGNFSVGYYWSSSEVSTNEALVCPFNAGGQVAMVKGTGTIYVRAIRAF